MITGAIGLADGVALMVALEVTVLFAIAEEP
jgi:uncharacterized membrane protein